MNLHSGKYGTEKLISALEMHFGVDERILIFVLTVAKGLLFGNKITRKNDKLFI